jgi:hypothetical protein
MVLIAASTAHADVSLPVVARGPQVTARVRGRSVEVHGTGFDAGELDLSVRLAPGRPEDDERCYGFAKPVRVSSRGTFTVKLSLPSCRWRCDGRPDGFVAVAEITGGDFVRQFESPRFACYA